MLRAILVLWIACSLQADDAIAILRRNCFGCHGAAMQQNGLRLDNEVSAIRGGYSGPVVQNGKLLRMVTEGKMPPGPRKLAAADIAVLKAWIEAGPKWPAGAAVAEAPRKTDHWSFQPLRKPAVPAVRNNAWVRNPIDAFVLARLEKEGIAPSAEASAATLRRRVSLDLTGLPPDPAAESEKHEEAVDRLLRSPHHGEKWARHWLDQARYADSDGYETDRSRPHAWRYREWVIGAINRGMPFDRFTVEQLAGDLLPNATGEQRVATGFHRNAITNREGGVDTEEFRVEATLDRANTVATAWLGLTAGCAQCHDHKYDPLSQRDYYRFYGFFNTMLERDIDAPLPGETGGWLQGRRQFEEEKDALLEASCIPRLFQRWEEIVLDISDKPSKNERYWRAWKNLGNISVGGQAIVRLPKEKRSREERETLLTYFLDRGTDVFEKKELDANGFEQFRKKWRDLAAKAPAISRAQTVLEHHTPPATRILLRGNFRNPGIEVEPGVPAALPPLPAGAKADRLSLARWLVSRENPLTARVTVNRVWQEYFGRGLVRTSEDFGKQGERPTHPELLDWLAAEFMDRGWNMRDLHRLIVTSATYRQSSHIRPELKDRDPDNTLLARQSRLRLNAEAVRDTALSAGGLLNPAVGGRSVRPPQPKGVSELTYASNAKWVDSQGPDRYRRALYIHFQRTSPYPQLMNFDAPESVLTCSRRQRSNTPLQALNLLNDPVFLESAQALALRMLRESAPGFRERLAFGYRQARPNFRNQQADVMIDAALGTDETRGRGKAVVAA